MCHMATVDHRNARLECKPVHTSVHRVMKVDLRAGKCLTEPIQVDIQSGCRRIGMKAKRCINARLVLNRKAKGLRIVSHACVTA